MVKIQLIRQRKIKDFKRKNYKIPTYHSKIILDEAKLFSDWYLKRVLTTSQQLAFKKNLLKSSKI